MKWLTWAVCAATAVLLADDLRLRSQVDRMKEEGSTSKLEYAQLSKTENSCMSALYSCRDTVDALAVHTQNVIEAQARHGPGLLLLAKDWRARRAELVSSIQRDLHEIQTQPDAATASSWREGSSRVPPREARWPNGG